VRTLLEAGRVAVDAFAGKTRWTALHAAAQRGRLATARAGLHRLSI
jgi:hypothetical protein